MAMWPAERKGRRKPWSNENSSKGILKNPFLIRQGLKPGPFADQPNLLPLSHLVVLHLPDNIPIKHSFFYITNYISDYVLFNLLYNHRHNCSLNKEKYLSKKKK